VVRQVVGHGRLVGAHAYRQLDELYRALHWYVNCFQPSMKLISKQVEGRTIRRIYDAAKTPLQRVVLSEVLSPCQQQKLHVIGKALDPLRLFQQVEQLQRATWRYEAGYTSASHPTSALELVSFDLAGCAAERVLLEVGAADALSSQEQNRASVLNWRRTSKDPFIGQWEQIFTWVQANPTRRSGDILRELQLLSPGRYEGSHLRTLQRGIRKIRVHLLRLQQETGSPEQLGERRLSPVERSPARRGPTCLDAPCCPENTSMHSSDQQPAVEERSSHPGRPTRGPVGVARASSMREASQIVRRSSSAPSGTAISRSRPEKEQRLTIARAVQEYLQAHRSVADRPKTLEWHQTALTHFQASVQTEGHLLQVQQISEATIEGWLASLAQTPTARGTRRSASTIETYARSVRAFCQWLVERGTLSHSPLSEHAFPRARVPLPQVISAATFEQLMRAGFSQQAAGTDATRQAARDQALLWVLFETGITLSEVCALRVADLDPHMGLLQVRGKGGKDRQMLLGSICLSHLRGYLRQRDAMSRSGLVSRLAVGDPLFSTAGKEPLSRNGVSMVVVRFRTRAGLSETTLSPQVLRHSFALRYLQAGGSPQGLQALMGYEGMVPVRQYLRWDDQLLHHQTQQEAQEV